jgi:sugar phosphate isomerase/epimerase
MKFGIFTVSTPDWYPLEVLEKIKELGLSGVEWRVVADDGDTGNPTFWNGNRASMTAEYIIENASQLKLKSDECGVEMVSLASYLSSDASLEIIEQHFIASQALGVKNLRFWGNHFKKEVNYMRQIAKSKEEFFKLETLARKYGVRAVIEIHMHRVAPSMSKAMMILEGLDPRYVGIIWDPGNQVVEGFEPYEMALDIAGDYLAEIHIKNMEWLIKSNGFEFTEWECKPTTLRKGIVNWPLLMKILKDREYKGWLFFEDFSTELPLDERMKDNVSWIKGMI